MYKLNWKKARDRIIDPQNQFATALESSPKANPESCAID
jgi:hypothetical protein